MLFDATMRKNLFVTDEETGAATLAALAVAGEQLGALGLLDLIRGKGLDALPA